MFTDNQSITLSSQSHILVVGTSGSGKSTLARELALKLQIDDIELDALFWKENWTQSSKDEFREKVKNSIDKSSGWIMHGNYSSIRDLSWGKAETVIWLDYSLPLIMWRVIKRSLLRIIKKELLWADNKESLKKTFFSKESIILWAWQTYPLRKKQYTELTSDPYYKHVQILRLQKPIEAQVLLSRI